MHRGCDILALDFMGVVLPWGDHVMRSGGLGVGMSRIKEGDWVKVPQRKEAPSGLARTGKVEILKPPYARVVLNCGHKRMRMVFTTDQLEKSA